MISFRAKGFKKNKNIMTSKKLERQKCEIYSRVVGYLSPIHRWNKGKRAEFDDRKEYSILPTNQG
jgi:anaerobic ribonucleoside-triphosphate reductase